jgi:hypothetical protein
MTIKVGAVVAAARAAEQTVAEWLEPVIDRALEICAVAIHRAMPQDQPEAPVSSATM